MIILLSPSKTLDLDSEHLTLRATQPAFLERSETLVAALRKYSPAKLQTLMDISPKLASLNAKRFHDFQTPFTANNSRPALFTFMGDVYEGLNAVQFDARDVAFAQTHLRILSGLYGLLRPLDRIQPYRLEMGTVLATAGRKDLYGFWGTQLADMLNQSAKVAKSSFILNLASQEYAKAVPVKALAHPLIEVKFQEEAAGKRRTIALFAKRARGLLAAYAIRERATTLTPLQGFAEEGYRFHKELSGEHELVFTRSVR